MVESNKIDADYIISYILRNYTGIVLKNLWGEKALLYNSNNKLQGSSENALSLQGGDESRFFYRIPWCF